jgi:hypothetical protein
MSTRFLPNPVTKVCKECRKDFQTDLRSRRFCCDKCRNENWVRLHRYKDGEERKSILANYEDYIKKRML